MRPLSCAKKIYYLIPEPIRRKRHDITNWFNNLYWIIANGFYDICQYAKFSSSLNLNMTQAQQSARLTYYYHKIEKAMALPKPRAGFGKEWIVAEFIPLLNKYYLTYGNDNIVACCCINLNEYILFNKRNNSSLNEIHSLIIKTLENIEKPATTDIGGIKEIIASEIKRPNAFDFKQFINNRHSIRNFTSKCVDRELIEDAIQMAQRTPSVCNRQPWHVYALDNKMEIIEALKHQNGNAGFSENIQVLLIIAGDLSAMMNPPERHEIWVDGGMFSMSLVYSLHSMGLGTCCLNLCKNYNHEINLKRDLRISPDHSPVMMIAVGHIPDKLYVAQSQRKLLKEILTWNTSNII